MGSIVKKQNFIISNYSLKKFTALKYMFRNKILNYYLRLVFIILHFNWFCIDKRIDHLKWTSNNKNLYYTKELCSQFLHIHVLKNSRILYTFVRAYFAYLLLKNLRTVIVQKLQSVHWLLHVQINHDCIIIENIFNSCLWGYRGGILKKGTFT